MTDQPLVSVVTVVRNGADYLDEAIQSVLSQDYAPIEYIIIDGGSTDGTLDIVKSYESRLAGWSSEADDGIFDAMNKGIRRSTGQLVKLLNADDRLTPGSVAAAVKAYSEGDGVPAVIASPIVVIDGRGEALKVLDRYRAANPVRPTLHPSWYVDKRVYKQHGLYDTAFRIGADFDMLMRLHNAQVPFVYTTEPLAEFRVGGKSSATGPAIAERFRILRRHYDLFASLRAMGPYTFRQLRQASLLLLLGEKRMYQLRALAYRDNRR